MSASTLDATKKVYLVEGASGQYSGYSSWIVNGWLSEEAAEMEAARLNAIAQQLEHEKAPLGDCPDDSDSPEWAKWWEAHHALEEKYRALSGDESLAMSPFNDTDYRVLVTEIKG